MVVTGVGGAIEVVRVCNLWFGYQRTNVVGPAGR